MGYHVRKILHYKFMAVYTNSYGVTFFNNVPNAGKFDFVVYLL